MTCGTAPDAFARKRPITGSRRRARTVAACSRCRPATRRCTRRTAANRAGGRRRARRRAGRRVARIDVDERVFGLGHAELVKDVVGSRTRRAVTRSPSVHIVSAAAADTALRRRRSGRTAGETDSARAGRRSASSRACDAANAVVNRGVSSSSGTEQRVPVAIEIHETRSPIRAGRGPGKARRGPDAQHLFPSRPALRADDRSARDRRRDAPSSRRRARSRTA